MKIEDLITLIEEELTISIHEIKNLQFEKINEEHVVSLVDAKGYKILSGYGNTVIAAMNDLHSGLL